MTRLTKKGVTPVEAIQTSTDIANMYHVYNKLSQLEDIEEELGVDLVKLLSSKEIYYKYKTGHISDCTLDSIDFNFRKICYVHKIENHSFDGCSFTEYFSDYGKTWAFTREELEK